MCEAKMKALISCAVTAQLICGFVFVYAYGRFSHDAAHLVLTMLQTMNTVCFITLLISYCSSQCQVKARESCRQFSVYCCPLLSIMSPGQAPDFLPGFLREMSTVVDINFPS